MYGHQAIESMKEIMKISGDEIIKSQMENVCNGIKKAQHFHLGNYQEMASYFKNKITDKDVLFMEERGRYIKLPYNSCWFDFNVSDDGSAKKEGLIHIFKRGILAQNIGLGEAMIVYVMSEYPAKADNIIPNKKVWVLSPYSLFISIGKNISECDSDTFPFLGMFDHKKYKQGNVFPLPNSQYAADLFFSDNETARMLIDEDTLDIKVLNMALMFLSCKNIGIDNNYPAKALNQKRKKSNKQELFTYKTLILKPFGKKQESIPKHLWDNKIHLCRGHFKTYSQEKPLLGKIVGRFWWQPQARGNKDNGIIIKDYKADFTAT